ncbi:hypothetical protein N665_0090s0012 [Sinapis alba]|nr:hypothetical protein N665_0090s0012 [Sinapis alba]
MNDNRSFGQLNREVGKQVKHLTEHLGAEVAVISYRNDGNLYTHGQPRLLLWPKLKAWMKPSLPISMSE